MTHFVIDWIKCRFCKDNLHAFLVDQFMHIAIICIVWFVFFGKEVDYTFLEDIYTTKVWLTIMAYIMMLRPSSIFLGLFLKKMGSGFNKCPEFAQCWTMDWLH